MRRHIGSSCVPVSHVSRNHFHIQRAPCQRVNTGLCKNGVACIESPLRYFRLPLERLPLERSLLSIALDAFEHVSC